MASEGTGFTYRPKRKSPDVQRAYRAMRLLLAWREGMLVVKHQPDHPGFGQQRLSPADYDAYLQELDQNERAAALEGKGGHSRLPDGPRYPRRPELTAQEHNDLLTLLALDGYHVASERINFRARISKLDLILGRRGVTETAMRRLAWECGWVLVSVAVSPEEARLIEEARKA